MSSQHLSLLKMRNGEMGEGKGASAKILRNEAIVIGRFSIQMQIAKVICRGLGVSTQTPTNFSIIPVGNMAQKF